MKPFLLSESDVAMMHLLLHLQRPWEAQQHPTDLPGLAQLLSFKEVVWGQGPCFLQAWSALEESVRGSY